MHAASLLGVRSAWLICYQGPPLEPFDELAADNQSAPEPRFDVERTVAKAICKSIGLPEANQRSWYRTSTEEGDDIPAAGLLFEEIPHWVPPLTRLRLRLRDLDLRLDPVGTLTAYRDGDHSAEEAVTQGIGLALAAPLSRWGVDVARMGEEDLSDYILSMVPALNLVAHERNRQRLEDAQKRERARPV